MAPSARNKEIKIVDLRLWRRRLWHRRIVVSHRAFLLGKRDRETLLAVYVLEERHKQADVKYSAFAFPEWKFMEHQKFRRSEELLAAELIGRREER